MLWQETDGKGPGEQRSIYPGLAQGGPTSWHALLGGLAVQLLIITSPKSGCPLVGEAVALWHKVSGSSALRRGTRSPPLLPQAACVPPAALSAGFKTTREAGIDAKAAVLCKLGLGM